MQPTVDFASADKALTHYFNNIILKYCAVLQQKSIGMTRKKKKKIPFKPRAKRREAKSRLKYQLRPQKVQVFVWAGSGTHVLQRPLTSPPAPVFTTEITPQTPTRRRNRATAGGVPAVSRRGHSLAAWIPPFVFTHPGFPVCSPFPI